MVSFAAALSPRAASYLIVVRRGDDGTYRYLCDRLAGVRGVEVTLDRRTGAAEAPAERRRTPVRFNAFGVMLVRR